MRWGLDEILENPHQPIFLLDMNEVSRRHDVGLPVGPFWARVFVAPGKEFRFRHAQGWPELTVRQLCRRNRFGTKRPQVQILSPRFLNKENPIL